MISLQVEGAWPEQRHAAQCRRLIDCRLQVRCVVGGDDGPRLGADLGRQPDEGRRPLVAPQGLAVLRQPALDGGTVEGNPHLTVRSSAILLHIAARSTDQGRKSRVILGGAPARDADQHDFQCRLECFGLRRLRAVGQGSLRLIKLRTSQG